MWWSKPEKSAADIQQALRNDENQALLDALNDSMAMIQFTPDGTILDANKQFLSAMGYRLENIKDKHHSMFCSKSYTNTHEYKKFWSNLASGRQFTAECLRINKQGEEVWLDATYCPVKDQQQNVYKIVKLATDITATIEQKHALQSNVDALNRSMATIEFNLDGTIITANDNFLSASGYSMSEIQGKHHRMFCHSETANSQEYQRFWQSLNNGEYHHDCYKRQTKSGND